MRTRPKTGLRSSTGSVRSSAEPRLNLDTTTRVCAGGGAGAGSGGVLFSTAQQCRKVGRSRERARQGEIERPSMGNTRTAQAGIKTRRVSVWRDADHCRVRGKDVL